MAGNNDVYFPGGAPPDPSGSGTQNDYSTGKNYDRDGGSAASPPTVAAWQVQDPGKGFSVKPDVLNQVASALQEDINNTQTVLQNLQGIGPQLHAAMGQWPTGQSFGYMAQDALAQVEQIHHSAGAIAASTCLLFVTFVLWIFLPDSWQRNVGKWLPFNAGSQVWQTRQNFPTRPLPGRALGPFAYTLPLP